MVTMLRLANGYPSPVLFTFGTSSRLSVVRVTDLIAVVAFLQAHIIDLRRRLAVPFTTHLVPL